MLQADAAATKAILYAGLLSCAGAAFANATLRLSDDAAAFVAQVVCRGALLTICAALTGAALLALRLGGEIDATILSAVFVSSAGAATALQLAGAVLLLTTTGKDAFARTTQAFNAAVAMASFAFTGHAAAVGLIEGLVAFAHASAAAWWVGSLWALRYECAHSMHENLAAAVVHFSRKALVVIGALVLAGIVLIFVLVDFARDPWLTPYAQVLIMKIAAGALVLALATYNKFRLTPRLLARDGAAATALRRSIVGEFALIGVVLVITAILTTYLSPHSEEGSVDAPAQEVKGSSSQVEARRQVGAER
jgi:copper resistance protein D